MRQIIIGVISVLALAGCSAPPPPNAKTLKFETQGSSVNLTGLIKAGNPGSAGLATKSFDIKVPGSLEFKAGPSEYTMTLDGLPKAVTLKLFVDGKELKRGQDIVWEEDKGPRLTFNVR